MASKDSSKTIQGAAFLLKSYREKPPTVFEVPKEDLAHIKVTNAEVIGKIKAVNLAVYELTTLVALVSSFEKTVFAVDAVRINQWGKIEIRLVEVVHSLKAQKASPAETEKLSWFAYTTNDEEQVNFLANQVRRTSEFGGKLPAPGFALRCLDINLGKSADAAKKNPVYGRFQILVFPLKSKAATTVETDPSVTPLPPPKKRSRKQSSGGEGSGKDESLNSQKPSPSVEEEGEKEEDDIVRDE